MSTITNNYTVGVILIIAAAVVAFVIINIIMWTVIGIVNKKRSAASGAREKKAPAEELSGDDGSVTRQFSPGQPISPRGADRVRSRLDIEEKIIMVNTDEELP